MPCRRVLGNSTAILRAVAVTALALPTRPDRRRGKAPSAVSVRPTATAASRSRAAARLFERRVLAESTLPPEILLLGARHSHEVKCLALGQAERLVPHSPTSLSARYGPRPWIRVRSTPRIRCKASRAGKASALAVCAWWRGAGSGAAGAGRSACSRPPTAAARAAQA